METKEKKQCEADRSKPYSKGSYNEIRSEEQQIRLSEGCPNKCPFCRESWENPKLKVFEIPEIVRNKVRISDMNLLCQKGSLEIIKELGRRKVNNKVIYYELLCGIDWRFLDQEKAVALRQSRFKNIRIAWDYSFSLFQKDIRKAIELLKNTGYKTGKHSDIMIFMICNWKTTYKENLRKLDLCKVWNVLVSDCYFDNQVSPNIKPIHWKEEQIKDFRKRVRKHNQLINFGIDPEPKKDETYS